jgi:cellulose synthase (UDP-forming)
VKPSPKLNYQRETRITRVTLVFFTVAWAMATWETSEILWHRIEDGNLALILEQALFILIVQALLYGNFIYQFTRLGHLQRRANYAIKPKAKFDRFYEKDAPWISILVPSYREEITVIFRTLISAALQDYPHRRIALLVDDPSEPRDPADIRALHAVRQLTTDLQDTFNLLAAPFIGAQEEFVARLRQEPICLATELDRLALLCEEASSSVSLLLASRFSQADHTDALLLNKVLNPIASGHKARAEKLRDSLFLKSATTESISYEYSRLAALFRAEFTNFERKRYVNLSHEANKAMNLNSYIGLIGGYFREIRHQDGLHLIPATKNEATLHVPATEFLLTLDADSILLPEYASTLISEMLRPGNEGLAVAQTPYSAIPQAPDVLERVAGATTDIQYLIHQGFTHFGATFWVGANALLRMDALCDIREEVDERGFQVPVFIQDRTVIEDTESTIDLVARGWRLYNHPDRLAYSATPPDFGSLLIQRRRWANGGLIILPKLLRYAFSWPVRRSKLIECFFRFHYLTSIAAVNFGLLIMLGHSFDASIESPWLPLTALPYFFLYGRDLRQNGYPLSDLVRIYALNLLMIPINLGGVLKSIQQGLTGQRIPFGRTPKVIGRTAAPAGYVLAAYVMLGWWLIGSGMDAVSERWISSIFCFANATLLAYAIDRFIGLSNSWADILGALPRTSHSQIALSKVPDLSQGYAEKTAIDVSENYQEQWSLPYGDNGLSVVLSDASELSASYKDGKD